MIYKPEAINEIAKSMKIVKRPPPNAEAIEKVFPGVTSGTRPIYFCYGNTIYNPHGKPIVPSIIAHECVHALQQARMGEEHWWALYLTAKTFRFEQELDAHRAEYEHFRANNNRAFSRRYLRDISERLAGPLYGSLATRTHAKALILTTEDEHATA